MNSKELLIPRYEVIALWPSHEKCKLVLGEVIELTPPNENIFVHHWMRNGIGHLESWFDKYPHLFRPLGWWEGRTESEMPNKLAYSELWLQYHSLHQTTYNIVDWDMSNSFGYTKEDKSAGCSLGIYPKSLGPKGYAYVPLD